MQIFAMNIIRENFWNFCITLMQWWTVQWWTVQWWTVQWWTVQWWRAIDWIDKHWWTDWIESVHRYEQCTDMNIGYMNSQPILNSEPIWTLHWWTVHWFWLIWTMFCFWYDPCSSMHRSSVHLYKQCTDEQCTDINSEPVWTVHWFFLSHFFVKLTVLNRHWSLWIFDFNEW